MSSAGDKSTAKELVVGGVLALLLFVEREIVKENSCEGDDEAEGGDAGDDIVTCCFDGGGDDDDDDN